MESTSEIIDLVIQKCIELFELEQQKVDFLPNGINYGKPPKTAIIAYGLGEMKKIGYQITDIQKKWLYENGCLEETDMTRERNLEQRSGMYYSEAYFDFSFDTDNYWVYLNISFGPRYARGVRFELMQEENTISLCNDKVLWVS
ncbi:MAG: hypothetical protein K2J90_10455 [Lachnospiraceae bacterium]|nr:hypothetical protein [Lachnospiraceae bacterium]